MYTEDDAAVYDLLYAGKDYAAESAQLSALIRDRVPHAASLLDVACGTGRHLAHLAGEFGDAAGLEQSAAMAAVARERLDGVTVAEGDMRDFDLGRRFDAVVCLFGSIGYMRDTAGLRAAVAAMAAHVNPGGLLAIEGFIAPEDFEHGRHVSGVHEDGGRTLVRLSVSRREGSCGVMDVHLLLAEGTEVQEFRHRHVMGLYGDEDIAAAFTAAGMTMTRVDGVLTGRGLYVGTARA